MSLFFDKSSPVLRVRRWDWGRRWTTRPFCSLLLLLSAAALSLSTSISVLLELELGLLPLLAQAGRTGCHRRRNCPAAESQRRAQVVRTGSRRPERRGYPPQSARKGHPLQQLLVSAPGRRGSREIARYRGRWVGGGVVAHWSSAILFHFIFRIWFLML